MSPLKSQELGSSAMTAVLTPNEWAAQLLQVRLKHLPPCQMLHGSQRVAMGCFQKYLQVPVAFIDQLDRADAETALTKHLLLWFARFMGCPCGRQVTESGGNRKGLRRVEGLRCQLLVLTRKFPFLPGLQRVPSLSFFSQSLQGAGPWPVVHSPPAGRGGGGGGGQLAVVCLLPGAAVGAMLLAAVRPRWQPFGEGRWLFAQQGA